MNTPIDISDLRLRSDRLTLRPWRESDLSDFYEYARVDGVGQMAGWIPHRSPEESKAILSQFIESKNCLALEYEGRVIGSLGIEKYREDLYPELSRLQGRELGYVLSRDYWGRGLIPEAAQTVITYLFETVGLDFVIVGHFDWNRQSRRVVEKCGFSYVKTIDYKTHYGTTERCLEYILYSPSSQNPSIGVIANP